MELRRRRRYISVELKASEAQQPGFYGNRRGHTTLRDQLRHSHAEAGAGGAGERGVTGG